MKLGEFIKALVVIGLLTYTITAFAVIILAWSFGFTFSWKLVTGCWISYLIIKHLLGHIGKGQ